MNQPRAVLALLCIVAGQLPAQEPALIRAERDAFATWLAKSPISPYAAVAQLPVGSGLQLGPADADLALPGIGSLQVTTTGGSMQLVGPQGRQAMSRGRPVRAGHYLLVANGTADRPVVTIFDSTRARGRPAWYPFDPSLSFVGRLIPPDSTRRRTVLSPDGVEVLAEEAGSVLVPINGHDVRLAVLRLPDPATDEADLEIYFRDGTNGQGTYPAGRFVALIPAGARGWRLDFNRARNPFCSYSSAYACPAPWRGNTIDAPIRAGEQYLEH